MSDVERDGLAPADAFAVLGDETRIAIVEELAAAVQADEEGLSFSELRKRVGVRDDGQFNYHLSKLRDRFVVKRDGGYHPQYPALRAVGAIESGTYTGSPPPRTSETDFDCPACDESLTAVYEDERVRLDCPNHGWVFRTSVPPKAALDRSVEELLALANADTQRDTERAVDGTCPMCWGRVTTTAPGRLEGGYPEDNRVYVELECEDCWMSMQLPVGGALVRHPAVVSFYHDHGVDVRRRPYLSFDFVRDPDAATVVSRDPVRMRVTTELDGDSLSLTVDGDLNVVAVEES